MQPVTSIFLFLIFTTITAAFGGQTALQQNPAPLAQYPGGSKALTHLFTDSIDLPSVKWEEVSDAEANGQMVLSLAINEKGEVYDAKVVTSMGAKNDARCLKLARKLKFIAASVNGKPVKSTYLLHIERED